MPVERHLVGAGRRGDRVDAHGVDTLAIEQIPGDREDAFSGRPVRRRLGRGFFLRSHGVAVHFQIPC